MKKENFMEVIFIYYAQATFFSIWGDYLLLLQLQKLVNSADWSKVHHVTQGIFCNDSLIMFCRSLFKKADRYNKLFARA